METFQAVLGAMQSELAAGRYRRVHPAMDRRLATAQWIVLAAGAGMAIVGLAVWLLPQRAPEWLQLPADAAMAALACAIGLGFSFSQNRSGTQTTTRILAVATGLPGLVAVAAWLDRAHGGFGTLNGGMAGSEP